MVLWNKPNGGDEIDQYYIAWRQLDRHHLSGYKYVKHKLGKINYTSTITNLLFGTRYKIWVVPKNSAGYGSDQTADFTTGSYN